MTKPRGGKEHAQPEWLSLQTAGFAPSRSGALVTRGGGGESWLGEHGPILPAPWDPRGGGDEVQGAAGAQREGIEAQITQHHNVPEA